MTSYPFAIDLEKDHHSLRSILSLIEYLENVVEWMFIYETEVAEEEKQPENEEDNEGPFREPISSLKIPSDHEELRR